MIAITVTSEGHFELAAQIVGLVDHHADQLPDWMIDWTELVQLQTMLEQELGEDDFQQNWQQGSTLDPYELVDTAITEHLAVDVLAFYE